MDKVILVAENVKGHGSHPANIRSYSVRFPLPQLGMFDLALEMVRKESK